MINYTIHIINIQKKIIYKKSSLSLLLVLESNNINIEYQCRSGYCGMCRIKLINGNIYYPKEKPIAYALNKKEIFPCYCQPKGNIQIKI